MTDLQIQGKKIALLDSSNNIVYTLPDSAGSAGEAIITDGAGKLFYGGINIDAVLAAGDSSSKNLSIGGTVTANIVEAGSIINRDDDVFQGTSFGYVSGGIVGRTPTFAGTSPIHKFSFTSNVSITDVGILTNIRRMVAGNSSATHGYSSGGRIPSQAGGSPPGLVNTIDKFPFATDTNASDVGDLDNSESLMGGQSSRTHGYNTGGHPGVGGSPAANNASNVIQKFPFATDTNGSNVGDLTVGRYSGSSQSSTTHGYFAGGRQPDFTPFPFSFTPNPDYLRNQIDKFPFSSDTNASDVGDLTTVMYGNAGQSSSTHGYSSGGIIPPAPFTGGVTTDIIQKFPFASDTNASDVGDLAASESVATGQSSVTDGYISDAKIQKFPFASDANGVDLGDLLTNRDNGTGQQV